MEIHEILDNLAEMVADGVESVDALTKDRLGFFCSEGGDIVIVKELDGWSISIKILVDGALVVQQPISQRTNYRQMVKDAWSNLATNLSEQKLQLEGVQRESAYKWITSGIRR